MKAAVAVGARDYAARRLRALLVRFSQGHGRMQA